MYTPMKTTVLMKIYNTSIITKHSILPICSPTHISAPGHIWRDTFQQILACSRISYKWNQTRCTLLSVITKDNVFNRKSKRLFHVVGISSSDLFIADYYSIIRIYLNLFIHSPADRNVWLLNIKLLETFL